MLIQEFSTLARYYTCMIQKPNTHGLNVQADGWGINQYWKLGTTCLAVIITLSQFILQRLCVCQWCKGTEHSFIFLMK